MFRLLPPLLLALALVPDTITGPRHEGRTVKCDLPISQQLDNRAGIDGVGLCVPTSVEMAARWKGVKELYGFRDYRTQFTGGDGPERLSAFVKEYSRLRGRELIEGVDWGQTFTQDPRVIDTILDNYGIACIAYGRSPRYSTPILHMVCLVMLDAEYGVILDNNFPGTYEWVGREEVIDRWKTMKFLGGWVVWVNGSPPPPVPINK